MSKNQNRFSLGVISNSLLFVSSFLLLINFAPPDLFPSYRKAVKAIQKLKEAENILGNLPKHITVNPGSKSLKISNDLDALEILIAFIKKRSPLTSNVDWQQAIGVGYTSINVPVWKKNIDVFHPLYIVTMPTKDSDTFNLDPVGQLSDLETWLKESHLSSLNKTAIFLLAFGFLLQLLEKILERRSIT